MDCVNHSGVSATAYCQNCGKPLCQACVRSAARGADLLRAMRDGVAGHATALCGAASGCSQPGPGGCSGTDSRRGRHVQRPVHQGPDSRGDLCGAGERRPYLRNLWPLHCGLGLLPGFRGVSHREGAARRRAVARSAGAERNWQPVCCGRAGSAWARSWHSRTGAGGFVSSSKSGRGSGEPAKHLIKRRISLHIKPRIRVRIKARIKLRIRRPRRDLAAREFRRFHRCRLFHR